jgi:hypothetical protein
MKALGTILPTAKSLALEDRHYKSQLSELRAVEKRLTLPGEKIGSGFDAEYWDGNKMRLIGRDYRVRLFEKRADGGTYFVKYEN